MSHLKLLFPSLLFITMAKNTYAQDWANLNFYKDANKQLLFARPVGKRVVLFGDSTTQGWAESSGNPEFFTGKPYVNRGIGGQTTPQMLLRFRQDVVALHPIVVVILAGTNDIAGNTGPSTLQMIMDNMASMAEIAHANHIRPILCSVLPAYDYPWKTGMEPTQKIIGLNVMIKAYADMHNIPYVDYFSAMADTRNGLKAEYSGDGMHPNRTGYLIWRLFWKKRSQKQWNNKSNERRISLLTHCQMDRKSSPSLPYPNAVIRLGS